MASIHSLSDFVSQVQGYNALLEHYPFENLNVKVIADWLANGGNISQTFDILALIYQLFPSTQTWEEFLLNTVTKWLSGNGSWDAANGKGHTVLQSIEMTMKTALIAACQTILDCNANPIIPDSIMDTSNTGEKYDEGLPGYKSTLGEGVLLPLSFLDILSTLKTPPIGSHGKYCYFDVTDSVEAWVKATYTKDETEYKGYLSRNDITIDAEDPEKATVTPQPNTNVYLYKNKDANGEKVLEESLTEGTIVAIKKQPQKITYPISANDVWKSRDFDAFLWYVINRGGSSSRAECIWDNRYKPFKYSQDHNSPFHNYITPQQVYNYNKQQLGIEAIPTLTIKLYNDLDTYMNTGENPESRASALEWAYKNYNKGEFEPKNFNGIPDVITASGGDKIANKINEFVKERESVPQSIKVIYQFESTYEGITRTYKKTKTVAYSITGGEVSRKTEFAYGSFVSDYAPTGSTILCFKPYQVPFDGLKKALKTKKTTKDKKDKKDKEIYKKKQFARFQYEESNTYGEGGIRMWVEPMSYYRCYGVDPLAANAPMLQWDWEFINSIQFFEPSVTVSRLIDAIFNLGSQMTLSFSHDLIEEMVGKIVDNIITIDDTQVEDCYFSFSNDEYNEMIANAEKKRRGMIAQGVGLNLDTIWENIENENKEASLVEDVKIIQRTINDAIAEPGNEFQENFGIDGSGLLRTLLVRLCSVLTMPLFTPKCMIMLALNTKVSGKELTTSKEVFLDIIFGICKQVILAVKDMLVQMLTSVVMEAINELMSKVMTILVAEEIDKYRRLLEQLYDLFRQWYKLFGSRKGAIDNVTYADIDNKVSIDPEEKGKC